MITAPAAAAGMTALEQIDSRPLTKNQKNLISLVVVGNVSEFFDMFLIGFAVSSLLKDPAWHLKGFEAGWIIAMSGLGTVIGAIAWGRLADRIGRKAAFSWCVLLFTVFTLASVFTPNDGWIILAILRIFVGIGVGGLNITSIPYVQEFVPAKQRGLLSGLASVFIPFGLFLGSVAQMIVGSNWRLLIALGAIPIFLLFWLRMVPESPRFLQSRGRTAEARNALAWALDIPVEQLGALPEIKSIQSAPTRSSSASTSGRWSSSPSARSASSSARPSSRAGASPSSARDTSSAPGWSAPSSWWCRWGTCSVGSLRRGSLTGSGAAGRCSGSASSALSGCCSRLAR